MHGARAKQWRMAALAGLLITAATAQDRVATGGRVLGADGQPVANATVQFVGSAPPHFERFAPADVVTATTNDKGRFQVLLRERADYDCWAAGPAAADGMHACSEVVAVRPGTGFEITLATTTAPRELMITGLDAWRDHGVLRLDVALALAHLQMTPLATTDGRTTLPLAPPRTPWHLFVRDASGELCWSERIEPGADATTFQMPPPRAIPVHVVDAQGQPIADAVIRCFAPGVWRYDARSLTPHPLNGAWPVVGRTDATGRASVVVPCREDPFANARAKGPLLLVGKRDHAAVLGGWHNQQIGDAEPAADSGAARQLNFTLRAGPSFTGRLLGRDGKPMAQVAIALSGHCVMTLRTEATLRTPTTFTTRTGADGTFCFDALPRLDGPTLHVAGADGSTLAPALFTPDLTRPFAFDARELATIDLTVRDLDGAPARGAEVVLLPSPIGTLDLDSSTWRCRLDNRGITRLQVQPGAWSVFVTDRRGFVCTTTTCKGPTSLTLSLAALPVLRGVLTLDSGDRADDVRLWVNSIHHERSDPPEQVAVLRAVGTRVNQWLAATTKVRDDGSFELPFLDVPGTKYSGGIGIGGRSAIMHLMAAAAPFQFSLSLR